MADRIERKVHAAVNATRSGKRLRIMAAFIGLSKLETGDVVAELFMLVEDAVEGVDRDALLEAATLPPAWNGTALIQAVHDRSLADLQAEFGSEEPGKVVASLLVLVADLQDARAKL